MEAETHWSLCWHERPPEEAANFNPAFCGELIGRTVVEYHKARRVSLNLAIAFLVLPLTLHRASRDALPKKANVAFAGWVADHNPLLAELPGRVNRLRPVTREALLFGVQHQLLRIDGDGLIPGPKPIRLASKPQETTDDANEARSAAATLGRWFANQGRQLSILQGMGVAP